MPAGTLLRGCCHAFPQLSAPCLFSRNKKGSKLHEAGEKTSLGPRSSPKTCFFLVFNFINLFCWVFSRCMHYFAVRMYNIWTRRLPGGVSGGSYPRP